MLLYRWEFVDRKYTPSLWAKPFALGNVCTESMLICCLELGDRKYTPSLWWKPFALGNVCTKGMLICCLELVDRKDIPSLLRNHSLWETCLPEVYSFIVGNLLTGSVPFVVENLFTRSMKDTHSLLRDHSVCEACFPEVGNFLTGNMRLLLREKPVY